jgi:hypothetical protein
VQDVDDQVGLAVAENQVAAHEPVFEAVGQPLQPIQVASAAVSG